MSTKQMVSHDVYLPVGRLSFKAFRSATKLKQNPIAKKGVP